MEALTKERASRILNLLEKGKDESMIFKDGFDYEHTLVVGEEFHRLEGEIEKNIGVCKSESELVGKLESDLLNPREVIKAVIQRKFSDYDGYATFKLLKNGT
jgi:hypothetical protein